MRRFKDERDYWDSLILKSGLFLIVVLVILGISYYILDYEVLRKSIFLVMSVIFFHHGIAALFRPMLANEMFTDTRDTMVVPNSAWDKPGKYSIILTRILGLILCAGGVLLGYLKVLP